MDFPDGLSHKSHRGRKDSPQVLPQPLVAWIKTLGSRPKAKSAVLVQDDDERVASVIGWYEAYFYALFLIGLVVVDFEAERLARFGVSVQEFVVAGAEFYKGAGKFAATGAS